MKKKYNINSFKKEKEKEINMILFITERINMITSITLKLQKTNKDCVTYKVITFNIRLLHHNTHYHVYMDTSKKKKKSYRR